MAVILLAALGGGLVFLAVLAWTAHCYFRGGGICGGGGGSSYRKRNSRAAGEGGGGGRWGGSRGHPAQSFPRAFMPISVVPSSWTTVENGGVEEDGGIENNTLAGTNPLFSLKPHDDRPQPPPPRTGGTSGRGGSVSGRGVGGGVTKAVPGGGGKSAGASGGGGAGGAGSTSSQPHPAWGTAAAVARAPVSTMPSSDNPRPPPQRRRTSSGQRLTAAAAAAASSIEEGNEEEQALVCRPVSLEKAKSEPSTATSPPARRAMPESPATTCTLLASVGPSFLQGGSVQDSCSSVNSGCFDQGSSGRSGVGDGSVCASSSSVTSGTGTRRARTSSSASVRKAAATSVTPRSTASAPMFSPGGGGEGRRRRGGGGGGGGDRPRSLPPPHSIPTSRSSSGRLLRHHDQRGSVAEVGGGHSTRQRSSGGVPLPSPSPSPAAAAAAAAASWAEVEALALTSIVPAVREAAGSVARLMKASGGGGGGGKWVGWYGSVARTLRRAVRVLAKATAHDERVERVLMDDIQESICEMSEIMQCYASRGLSAEAVFWSGLCHRRQSEAELAIALASQRLELVMKVRAGYSSSSSSSSSSLLEVSDRHSRMQRRSSQEILEDSKTRLREWRLHQVEIPATEVEVVGDEVLGDGDGAGAGGAGRGRGTEDKRNSTVSTTVYLGSCMGLNAAVKAFSFKGGGGGNGECVSSGSSQRGPRHKATGDEAREDKEEQEKRERREGGGGGTRWRETCGSGHDDHCLRCRRREAALVREVGTLQRLRGPHIVTVFGVVVSGDGGGDSSGSDSEERSRENSDAGHASDSSLQNGGRLLLAMELLPGGSLRQRLRMSAAVTAAAVHRTGAAAAAGEGSSESTAAPAPLPLDDRALRRIVGDVCSGMAHLADLGFVHGGLSSSNVLLDAGGRAKISDLGPLLRTPAAGNTTRLRYTAPEVLASEDTSLKSDVYSFGMLVLECLTRRLPWQEEDKDAATTAAAIDDGTTTSSEVEDARLSRAVMSGDRPGVPGDAPRDLTRVAKDCWAHDPASRPDMVRVLEDLYPTGSAAVVVAEELGEAVATGSTTAVDDDKDDHHHHHRNGKATVPHDDEDGSSSGPKPEPRGAGAVRGARGIGDGTTPRSFELSSPRKMFPFPSSGVGSPLATMTTPGTPSSSSGSRRRTASLETFSTLAASSTTSSARSSVSRHNRGASAGGGGGGGRVLGVGGGIAGGGVLFAERSHTMPARTQRSRSRKGDGADALSRTESLPCVP
ncbi:unnamed protein product [Ectocarpus sp. 4 AP-2014]